MSIRGNSETDGHVNERIQKISRIKKTLEEFKQNLKEFKNLSIDLEKLKEFTKVEMFWKE